MFRDTCAQARLMGEIIMKRKLLCLTALLLLCPKNTIYGKESSPIRRESPHVITAFMEPIPTFDEQHEAERAYKLIDQPGKITRTIFKEKLKGNNSNRGAYALYSGFVDTFNENGQIIFPRKQQKDEIKLIVTRKIRPVILRGNTVEHFVRIKDQPIEYYSMKRSFDKDNDLYYWTTKKQNTPESKIIPASALIIFVKPHQVKIYEGKTIAMGGQNLLLPKIYPTKNITTDLNGISFLKINKYFKPVTFKSRRAPDRIGQIIQQ